MPDDLKPLGLDGAPQKETAAPVTAPVSTPGAASVSEPARSAGGDDIAEWIAEHPEEPAAPEATEAVQATSNDGGTMPGGSPVQPDAPATEKPAQPAAPATEPPKPAAEATSAKTFDPSEKLGLAEGVEWTRAQVVQGLQERVAAVTDANAYRAATLGMSPQVVAETLTPILKRLSAEPQTAAFIDAFLADPERAAYLTKCATFFEEESPAPAAPAQPAVAQLPPDARRELTSLTEWKQQREADDARNRINTELANATSAYPILATDEPLRQQVFLTAHRLHQNDATKGFPDAVRLMKSILDNAQAYANAQSTPAAAPAVPTVPATLGSAGASPTSSRSNASARYDYADPDVAAWLNGEGAAAGFGS